MLKRLFGKKRQSQETERADIEDQAVFVYLNGSDLPQEIYDEYDLATVEDKLIEVIQTNNLGEFDGNEFGPTGVTLFMYGPDAEVLFAGVESTLRGYPLCQKARVVIRWGVPGSPQREINL